MTDVADLLAEKRADGFAGKLNIYTCKNCRGHIVTRDVDEGVTPFMLKCRATAGCDGAMHSSFYRVFDQSMREGWQWFKPASLEGLSQGEREHAEKGGLLLREAIMGGADA